MHGAPGEGEGHHMPRWVKVMLIVGAVVGLLVVGLLVFGNGEHGPRRHFSGTSDDATSDTGTHSPPLGHSAETPGRQTIDVEALPWP